eukprot:12103240-Ditylum_brightwellii.AAC.1
MYRSHVRTVSAFGDSAKFAIVGTIPSLDFNVLVLNFAGLLSQVIKGLLEIRGQRGGSGMGRSSRSSLARKGSGIVGV